MGLQQLLSLQGAYSHVGTCKKRKKKKRQEEGCLKAGKRVVVTPPTPHPPLSLPPSPPAPILTGQHIKYLDLFEQLLSKQDPI